MKIGKFEVSKKLFITLIVTVVLLITALIIKSLYVDRYQKYKIDKDKEFIYTYKTYDNSKTYVPYVNIDNSFTKTLNEGIQNLSLSYKDSNTSNNSMSYQYNENDNFVSLVIILKNLNSKNELTFDFATYVFDLKQEGKALTKDEILKLFNITEEEVNNEIELQMVKKYDDEINKNILPNTCSYKDCYLKLRNVNKYTDNAHYFIEDGRLVVYTSYDVYSEYKEEDYFTRGDFKFYITD